MKMTINTSKFQEMMSKSYKGASENKLLPITSLMAIDLTDNVLTLTTTDTVNYLKVISDKIEGDDLYVVVPAGIFSKLVDRTTAEKITLNVTENSLEVKGNGTHSIPLSMDEEGVVRFPDYTFKKTDDPRIVHRTSLVDIIEINKSATAKTIDTPCLSGYYLGEKTITTNEEIICFNDLNVFPGEEVLVSPEMMELLSLNTEEKIEWYRNDGYLLFETPNVIVYGAEHEGIDIFPVTEILGYLDVDFPSMCKLPKLLVQSVIDRLSLFIEPYDKNGAYFTFTKEGVRVTSKRSSSVETINYTASNNFQPFICCVDIPMFKSQVDVLPGEEIEIWYGNASAVKLVSGKVTQVIALLEDEDLERNAE